MDVEEAKEVQNQPSDELTSEKLSSFNIEGPKTSRASASVLEKTATTVGERPRTSLHDPEQQNRLLLPIDMAPMALNKGPSFNTMAKLAVTRHFDSDDSSEENFDGTIEASRECTSGEPGTGNPSSLDTVSSCALNSFNELSLQIPHQSSVVPPSRMATQGFRNVAVVTKDGAEYVRVVAPPGPLGLDIDDSQLNCAVVTGFVRRRDGSKSALECIGRIVPGSVIVSINQEDVSQLSLMEVKSKLSKLNCHLPRSLTFRLPLQLIHGDQHLNMLAPGADHPQALSLVTEDANKRRKLELDVIMQYDRQILFHRDCWFCIDAQWMARWAHFVCRNGSKPGPISNETLLYRNWSKRLANRPDGSVRDGLVLMKDYRVVVPFIWCLLAELHGRDDAPLLARYRMDIYAEALCDRELGTVLKEVQPKSVGLVNYVQNKSLVRSSRKCVNVSQV